MAYKCQGFQNGQVLTAECLNRMERGIEEACSGSIVSTECGTAIKISDSSDYLLHGLRIFGKNMQDETPTPASPVALESSADTAVILGGKNLWSNDDAVIESGGSCWTATETGLQFRRGDYQGTGCVYIPIPIPKDQTLRFRCDIYGDFMVTCILYGDTLHGTKLASGLKGRYSFTADRDYPGAVAALILSAGTGDVDITNIQITFGQEESFTPGKPLQILDAGGAVYGIPMQDVCEKHNYTDKNGQKWFTDEIDFARGVYIQRCFTVSFDGTEAWYLINGTGLICLASNTCEPLAAFDTGTNAQDGGNCAYHICSHFQSMPRNSTRPAGSVTSYGSTNGNTLQFNDATYNGDLEGWKAWLAAQAAAGTPVTMVLGRRNPVEMELPEEVKAAYAKMRTNKGDTTITNTACAYMEVSYVADTKLYIDKKFNELAAAIVNNV